MLSTADEVARALSVKKSTIRKWTYQRKIPFLRLGRSVRYEISAIIEKFKKQNEQ